MAYLPVSEAAAQDVAVDTIAALRATTRAALGRDIVYVRGYATAGDGGGGFFRYESASTSTDDDGIVVVTTTNSDRFHRVEYVNPSEINVNWFGVLPTNSDVTAKLINLLEQYPDAPLYWPQGVPNNRYDISLDINEDVNRTTQEARLSTQVSPQRNATQVGDWEYTPKWRGDAPTGESEESGTIISVADAAGKGYAIKASRRVANPQQWFRGHFQDIRFWGDLGDTQGSIIILDDTGVGTTFRRCQFRYCDNAVKLLGVWGVKFQDCVIGRRTSQDMDVGVWLLGSTAFSGAYAGWTEFRNCDISCDKVGVLSNNRDNTNPGHGDLFVGCNFENNVGLASLYIHGGHNWKPVRFRDNYMEAINTAGTSLDLTTYGLGAAFEPAGAGSITTQVGEAFRFVGRGFYEFADCNSLIRIERDKFASGDSGSNLTVDASDNTKVTPDGYTPVATDLGDSVEITTNTGGWTAGSYQINSVDVPGGTWTLASSPAATSTAGGAWYKMQDLEGPHVKILENRYPGDHVFDDDCEISIVDSHVFGANGGVSNIASHRIYPIDESIDQHACGRVIGHFTNLEPKFPNYFEQRDSAQFDFYVGLGPGGGGTITETTEDTPIGQPAWEVMLPAGGTQEIRILGHVGGTNYFSAANTLNAYTAVTFAIRAVTAPNPTLQIALRNSRNSSAYAQTIDLRDETWHSYCNVNVRGDGGYHLILRNPDVSNAITFRLGDIQAVRSTDREALREFLDTRCFATGETAAGTPVAGSVYLNGDSVIDARRDFGVIGDRSDETAKVQKVFDAAAGGLVSKVIWPSGIIRISSKITGARLRGVVFEGSGHVGGNPGAPWTVADLGGTIFENDGIASGAMFEFTETRFAKWTDTTFCNTLLGGTGNQADYCLHMPEGSAYGNGHITLIDCSFQLRGTAIGFRLGTVVGDNNAADVKLLNCQFWGDSSERTASAMEVVHTQGVNYSFTNCVFAWLLRAINFEAGGAAYFAKCDTFECLTLVRQVEGTDNGAAHVIHGGRFDDAADLQCTLFDTVGGTNTEPKLMTVDGITVVNRAVNKATVDPLFLLKDDSRVTIKNSQISTVPIARFYASTKTGITPHVVVENCELPSLHPGQYMGTIFNSPNWESNGQLFQIDNTDPGWGYARLKDCHRDQRPVPDWESGSSPHTWQDPDDFVQWINTTHSPTAVWLFDEGTGTTANDSSGNANHITGLDSGILDSAAPGGVPHRSGADWSKRTTLGSFDTGLDLTMSTTDYTFFMLLHKDSVPYNGTWDASDAQIFMSVTPDGGDVSNADSYASFPYIVGADLHNLSILDNVNPGPPTTTGIDNMNRGGWFPMVITWDESTQEVDVWLAGQHVDASLTTFPTVRSNWDMAGSSSVYLGGWRLASATREWNGYSGACGVIASKLTGIQAVELCARLMMTSEEKYCKATTP